MRCTFPTCESIGIVLERIAVEVGSTADELGHIETHVATMIEGARPADGFEQLQALDRLGQQLRAIEAFLSAATSCECGRVNIEAALDSVSLESVRKRLGGGYAPVETTASEPELW